MPNRQSRAGASREWGIDATCSTDSSIADALCAGIRPSSRGSAACSAAWRVAPERVAAAPYPPGARRDTIVVGRGADQGEGGHSFTSKGVQQTEGEGGHSFTSKGCAADRGRGRPLLHQ